MARRWPVLVVPGLYIADDATLEGLKAYATAGGHLVLTPRTGYADEEAVARHEVMPGTLREAAAVRYDEFTNLTEPVQVATAGEATISGAATSWADGLIAEGASVLAVYEHPHLRQFAAVTTNTFGSGRVTYVGTVPDRELSRSLALWITATSLSDYPWRTRWPSPVRCTSSLSADGRVLHFVHNWSWEPSQFTVPARACPMGSRTPIEAGAVLSLGPWDVQILFEGAGAPGG